MMGIAEHAAAEDLGVDLGPAVEGVVEPLEDEHSGPFTHDETRAIHIERSAGLRRIFVVGEHPHVVESGREEGMDGFRAAGDREIALSVANRTNGFEDGDGAAGAGCGVAEPRSAKVVVLSNASAGGVGEPLLTPRAFARRDEVMHAEPLDDVVGIAHVGPDRAANSLAIERQQANSAIVDCFGGRLVAEGDVF